MWRNSMSTPPQAAGWPQRPSRPGPCVDASYLWIPPWKRKSRNGTVTTCPPGWSREGESLRHLHYSSQLYGHNRDSKQCKGYSGGHTEGSPGGANGMVETSGYTL